MDRLKLTLAGCGLAALLAAPGCRNLRSEVPGPRPYNSDGRQMPPVGFSSDPHPAIGGGQPALPGTMGATEPSAMPGQFGTPGPGSTSNYGAPTSNAYGPPGTANLGTGAANANAAAAATPPAAVDPTLSMPPGSAGTPTLPPSTGTGLPGAVTPPPR